MFFWPAAARLEASSLSADLRSISACSCARTAPSLITLGNPALDLQFGPTHRVAGDIQRGIGGGSDGLAERGHREKAGHKEA